MPVETIKGHLVQPRHFIVRESEAQGERSGETDLVSRTVCLERSIGT